MKTSTTRGFIVLIGLLSFALTTSLVFFLIPKTQAEEIISKTEGTSETSLASYENTEVEGKYVLVFLDTMTLELRDGSTTLVSIPIISKGKPTSYYETPGGSYVSDYKENLHFSSIGHVYMPYSTHIFGNFFIHGIPYYPNGEKVSSNYSGGCIRLSDADAKQVYDFVEKGTPILITKKDISYSNTVITPRDMTSLMVATISLEFLTQDNPIAFNTTTTTRRTLLLKALHGNESVTKLFANQLGKEVFIALMNQKAQAIGMKDTLFTDITSGASTTEKDSVIFYNYLANYKSYLFSTSTLTD